MGKVHVDIDHFKILSTSFPFSLTYDDVKMNLSKLYSYRSWIGAMIGLWNFVYELYVCFFHTNCGIYYFPNIVPAKSFCGTLSVEYHTLGKYSEESLLWGMLICSSTAVATAAWLGHYLIPILGDFIANGLDKRLQYFDLGICNWLVDYSIY